MGSAIITGLKIVSLLVIGIILLVLANTMAMTARERVAEYALMKTLGFRPVHIVGLILGESLFIAALGCAAGLVLAYPVRSLLLTALGTMFPAFDISPLTITLAILAAAGVGLLAAAFPAIRAVRTPIVEALRPIE